jgi:hypothetical protein
VLNDKLLQSYRKVKIIEAEKRFSAITLLRQNCLGWWQGRGVMGLSETQNVKLNMADNFCVEWKAIQHAHTIAL